jgi:hypothetical protein
LKPGSHDTIWQVPLEHDSVACGRAQGTPQLPQFELVVVEVSQPSSMIMLQFLKPGLHVMPHVPPAQDGAPLLLEHTCPQPPQLPVLVDVFTSHPVESRKSQSAKLLLHDWIWQRPCEHTGVALGRLHVSLHAPQ